MLELLVAPAAALSLFVIQPGKETLRQNARLHGAQTKALPSLSVFDIEGGQALVDAARQFGQRR
jgi:hypothetical protein